MISSDENNCDANILLLTLKRMSMSVLSDSYQRQGTVWHEISLIVSWMVWQNFLMNLLLDGPFSPKTFTPRSILLCFIKILKIVNVFFYNNSNIFKYFVVTLLFIIYNFNLIFIFIFILLNDTIIFTNK